MGDGTEWQSDILGTLPKILGNLKRRWTQPDVRDEVIDYVHNWSDKTEISEPRLVGWIGISRSKYYDWRKRYGKVIEHNALVPRRLVVKPRTAAAIQRQLFFPAWMMQ